ncbi:sulfatase-like hydrolase/transferase [Antarctobacter sp.]|uniref:sulfatase-like hydrolase/transferase n=1 Tax=Antarctobacter sp. TaxID=1872577 RepID=UPI002B2757E4|nr:sulfatase-like hydrolase/transferase [Antarctobacter sp.]
MAGQRKNILLIMTDQQRATELFREEEILDLPAMRRLRKHGLSFRNTVCNSCMCSPSRSTLFTGTYPATHGVTQTLSYGGIYAVGQHSLDPSLPNMGNIFAKAGYDVQYRGKWHLSKAKNHPENPNALTAAEVALFGFKGWIPPDAGEDAEPEHFGGGWPDQDARYISEARAWIEAYRDSGRDDPFLMVLSLVNPHDVLAYPSRWEYGYTVKDFHKGRVELPATVHEDLRTNNKPTAQAQLLAVSAVGLGPLETDAKRENYLRFYAHLCEKIDGQIDGLLDLFFDGDDPNDLFRDTIIIRTSDHGEMGMSHGGLRQKAYNVYEETMRVPMIWANPELFETPAVTDELFSLVDVLPTLVGSQLGWAMEAYTKGSFAGTDCSALLDDPKARVQENVLFTFDDIRASSATQEVVVHAPDRIRCVRGKRWKYAEYFSADSSYAPQFELYDLDTPVPVPGTDKTAIEYHNLYYDKDGKENPDPDVQDQIARMRKELHRQMTEKLWT